MGKATKVIGTATRSVARRTGNGWTGRRRGGQTYGVPTRPASGSRPASARSKVMTAETLYVDLLPPDETPDMLIDAVRRWRREDTEG